MKASYTFCGVASTTPLPQLYMYYTRQMLVASCGEHEVQQLVHCITQTVWRCTVYRIYHVHRLKLTLFIKDAMACGKLLQFNFQCLLLFWLAVSRCSTVNTALLALLYCLHLANLASLCSGISADLSGLSRSFLCLSRSFLSTYKELRAR